MFCFFFFNIKASYHVLGKFVPRGHQRPPEGGIPKRRGRAGGREKRSRHGDANPGRTETQPTQWNNRANDPNECRSTLGRTVSWSATRRTTKSRSTMAPDFQTSTFEWCLAPHQMANGGGLLEGRISKERSLIVANLNLNSDLLRRCGGSQPESVAFKCGIL